MSQNIELDFEVLEKLKESYKIIINNLKKAKMYFNEEIECDEFSDSDLEEEELDGE